MCRSKLLKITAIASLGILPFSAYATNGMNPDGTGAKNRGMAGAGVAMANETASITNNPAAVVAVGGRWDVSLGLFSPKPRSYSLVNNNIGFGTGPTNVNFEGDQQSNSNLFAIPFFGISFPINSTSAWAFVMNANGGMNTDYPNNFGSKTGLSGSTGINLQQLFLNGTYGQKLGNGLQWGATLIGAYQTFKAEGLQAFEGASRYSSDVTNNGTDTSTGLGVKLGVRYYVGGGVTLGAAYQSKIKMSKFSKYKGLFPNQGELDIAPTYSVGLAWKSTPKLTVAFDYLYIDYGGVNAIGNSTSLFNPNGNPNTCAANSGSVCFGDSGGPGFGWKSINVFKLGFQYAYSDSWTWRAGWNHGDNPIAPSEVSVNFLAPGVIKDNLAVGFTHKLSPKSELTADFVHSFKNTVSGPFNAYFGGGTMTLQMTENYFSMGYSKQF